jgi:primosomal protein N' (replication factor Y)
VFARVVVDVAPDHLDHPFDYRVPDGATVAVGQRVRVLFSGRRRDGWVVGLGDEPETDSARVQPLLQIHPPVLFGEDELRLYRWVADRYAAPLAAVLRHAIPLRAAYVEREAAAWPPPRRDGAADRPPCADDAWRPYHASVLLRAVTEGAGAWWLRPLPGEDAASLVADLVARCLAGGRDALVLSPDPASGVPDAALAQAPGAGADLRGSDDVPGRYRAFLRARAGHARVAVGERGAVFAPLQRLGLIVVEDEANPAWKEQRSPRHHARDVALARAHLDGAVCVLLSDLPSAQLWRRLEEGFVQPVEVDRAEERRRAPRVEVVDRSDPRPGARRTRLSDAASRALSAAVCSGGAAVVLAARGGEGSALACRRCGRRRECPTCAASLRPPRVGSARRAGGRGRPLRASSAAGNRHRRSRRGPGASRRNSARPIRRPRSCAWRVSTLRVHGGSPPSA